MQIDSNTSVLFMLTFPVQNNECILFAYIKQIDELAPEKLYMYPKYGNKGKPMLIISNNNFILNQWFCIASDSEIDDIKKNLFKNQSVVLENINFVTPGKYDEAIIPENSSYKVKNFCQCSNLGLKYYKCLDLDNFLYSNNIYSYFDIPGNIKRSHDVIDGFSTKLFPFGFISLDDLSKLFEERITFIYSQRIFKYCFRGISKNDEKNINDNKYVGFIQCKKELRKQFSVLICQLSDEIYDKKSYVDIDTSTGLWELNTDIFYDEGILSIYNKKEDKIICAEKFYFIVNPKITVETDCLTYKIKDLYNREYHYSDKTKKRNKKTIKRPDVKIWFKETILGDENKIDIELSDYFCSLIQYCSPKILIYDPFFIGNIKNDGDINCIKITRSQKIFLNALIKAVALVDFEEICFLYSKEHKDKIYNNSDLEFYKEFLKKILIIDRLKIIIRETNKMHDRHILKIDSSFYDTFTISTSINGLVASDELKIFPIDRSEKAIIYGRIMDLWNKSKKGEIIID